MKLTFTRTDAAEWVASTERGDYTIVYDNETDTYTLYFLPAKAGSVTQHIADSIDRGYVEHLAVEHHKKGGDHAIR
jgi:hypothetical protein